MRANCQDWVGFNRQWLRHQMTQVSHGRETASTPYARSGGFVIRRASLRNAAGVERLHGRTREQRQKMQV
jgi:hypothetical protein